MVVSDSKNQRLLALQRLTLSGQGGKEGTVEMDIPANFTGDSLILRIISDGWRGVDVEKAVPWKPAGVMET